MRDKTFFAVLVELIVELLIGLIAIGYVVARFVIVIAVIVLLFRLVL